MNVNTFVDVDFIMLLPKSGFYFKENIFRSTVGDGGDYRIWYLNLYLFILEIHCVLMYLI